MKNNMWIKLLLVFTIFGGITSQFFSQTASASEVDSSLKAEENETAVDNMIESVRPYIYLADDGTIKLKESSNSLKNTFDLEGLQNYLDTMNKQVISGAYKVDSNLDYIPTMLARGIAGTSWKAHWWGYSSAFNHNQAKNFAHACTVAAIGSGATAAIPGLGFIGGMTAGYMALMAENVTYKNGKKGVNVKVTWAAVFTVTSR